MLSFGKIKKTEPKLSMLVIGVTTFLYLYLLSGETGKHNSTGVGTCQLV
jgi:hypothetical protein